MGFDLSRGVRESESIPMEESPVIRLFSCEKFSIDIVGKVVKKE